MSKTSLCDLPNPLSQFNRLTVGDLQAVYPLLAAPFPDEAIERTSGSETGRGYNTTGIGYQYIVDRFNAVLGPGHIRTTVNALTVSTTQTAKGKTMYQAECDLTLTIGNWVDGQWEVLAESQNYGGHDSLSVVDAKKGARSNAFKKTAAFFGPGHEAYLGILDEDARPAVVPDFPPGEFAIRLDDGSVVQKTSKDGKPYSLFTGKAVLVATGETFTLKAFGRLGDTLKDKLGETCAIIGAWNDRFGSFDVREVHLAPILPVNPPASDPEPAGPTLVAAAEPDPAPAPDPAQPVTRAEPIEPPDPEAPRRTLTTFDDLLPSIERLKALGFSSVRIADALKRVVTDREFRQYTPEDVRAAHATLQTLMGQLAADPLDGDAEAAQAS